MTHGGLSCAAADIYTVICSPKHCVSWSQLSLFPFGVCLMAGLCEVMPVKHAVVKRVNVTGTIKAQWKAA